MNRDLVLGLVLVFGLLSACRCSIARLNANETKTDNYIPVFVMLPLDTVQPDGSVKNINALLQQFLQLRTAGVDGVNTDIWWGVVERKGPKQYDWSSYSTLFTAAQKADLKVHVVMSFHQCGGNVGDTCDIPLPMWVRNVGNTNPSIYYNDQNKHVDEEYLSLGIDHVPVLLNRSAVQVYSDFMASFADTFSSLLGTLIADVEVGLGPAGELRYPSYQLDMWQFPGVGAFQCYDSYMAADLAQAACDVGHCEWGHAGPNNAGYYNSQPSNAPFFQDNQPNNYASDYGKFFLNWYSQKLIDHGDSILQQAQNIFAKFSNVEVYGKVAGIHWWYKTNSHAAELTAGYWNTDYRDGYMPIVQMFKQNHAALDFTCLEMRDSEQGTGDCGPEELVHQVASDAFQGGIHIAGENALARFDQTAYSEIEHQCVSNGGVFSCFTYLRLSDYLINDQGTWNTFKQFVNQMHNM
eukprot:ANDGO_04889.mRNA.1 Beta-amylase